MFAYALVPEMEKVNYSVPASARNPTQIKMEGREEECIPLPGDL
jgi:hypothetical protein